MRHHLVLSLLFIIVPMLSSAGWREDGTVYLIAYGSSVPATTNDPVVLSGSMPDYYVYAPTTVPESFAAYAPPVSNDLVAVDGTPEISEWIKSNEPDDTFSLVGETLSDGLEGADTRFVVYASGYTNDVLIQRLDGQQAALTLPSDLPADSMYIMWPRNNSGYGTPVAINKTESWWVTDRVSTGETFTVYGRNLALGGGSTYLWCEEESEWVTNTTGNAYAADFVLPTDWTNGTKTLWAHNGTGKEYGWADSVTLTVEAPVVWSGITTNVTAFGAVGDGVTDDTTAINAALTAVSGLTRPTVFFPAGTYAISSSITGSKNDMRLLGDTMDTTILTAHTSFSGGNLFNISGQTEALKFQNMTISSGTNMTDITPYFSMQSATDVEFESVHFTVLDHPVHTYDDQNGMEFLGSSHFTFDSCKFTMGSLVNMKNSLQAVFTNCDFYGLNDNQILLNAGASEQFRVVGCTGNNYDNSDSGDNHGWAQGRFFHASGSGGRLGDVYFADNATVDLTVRTGYANQNTGEQYLTDLSKTWFRGTATSATTNTVTFSDIPTSYDRVSVAIVSGRGKGQYRDIVSMDAGTETITVEKNWNVIPDTNSVIMVGTWPIRHAVYNNSFDGTDIAATTDTKSTTGVMFYGSGLDLAVENNTFHQLKFGIQIAKLQGTIGADIVDRPIFFTYVNSNSMTRVRRAINFLLTNYGGVPTFSDNPILGNVFRNTTISNTLEYAIWHRANTSDMNDTPIDLTIYDKNRIEDWTGYFIDRNQAGKNPIQNNTIYVGNTFLASGGNGISIEPDDSPAFHNNTWTGFTSDYVTSPPGAVLELPVRVIQMEDGDVGGSFTLFNSGTSSLSWTANESSSWLTLTKSSGTIADETATDSMTFTVSGTAADSVINIVVGGVTNSVTVLAPL